MREVKSNRGRKPACVVLAVVYTLAMIAFSGMLIWLNMLPVKYLIPLIAVILAGSFLVDAFLFIRKPKSRRRTAAVIISLLLIAVYGVGMYYIYSTQDLFAKISTIGRETEEYYLIVRKDDDMRGTYEDIAGDTVGILRTESATYAEAAVRLGEITDVNYRREDNIFDVGRNLLKEKCDVILVSSTYYSMICENIDGFEDGTRIIYKLTVEKEVEAASKSVEAITKTPFSVFISGIDIFGDINEISLSDVNMVMTVNPVTHTILLTSIPRDSYVMLHTYQQMDKLTHAGAYGVDESMMTIEDMLQVELNYYIRVNFSTVVDVVDAIGGITVNSDYEFTTHGRQNEGYSFVKGENQLDGASALAFARERYSFQDGDFQRNKNQQIVLKAMLDKILSSETLLTRYSQLLDAVENEMQTSISKSEIQALVKMQIDDMAGWTIKTQSITGGTGMDYCYSVGAACSVVYPDPVEVKKAVKRIDGVEQGAKQADGEWTWDFE